MAKRKRTLELGKRCACRRHDTCPHDWWLRVFAKGTRHRVNLTERYGLALPMARKDVEHHAAKAKHEARSGQLVAPTKSTRLTFGDVADRYVEAYPTRKHYYLTGLRETDVPSANGTTIKLQTKPVDDVTTADVKHVVVAWKKRPRFGPVAERHLLQTARHLFNWAIREGYATRTPFRREGVTVISVKPSKGRSRRLEVGEESKLLAVACSYISDFFTAMIETGCRPGELRTLQWREIREDELVVLATKAKDREERRIPIMPTLRDILDRRCKGPDGAELALDTYVFGNEVGEMLSRRKLCGMWLDTCQKAGVENLHLHDLRAEAGSQLLEAGVPIHEVRDALGHSSTTMTSAYLRTRVNSLKSAYQKRALRIVPRANGKAASA